MYIYYCIYFSKPHFLFGPLSAAMKQVSHRKKKNKFDKKLWPNRRKNKTDATWFRLLQVLCHKSMLWPRAVHTNYW